MKHVIEFSVGDKVTVHHYSENIPIAGMVLEVDCGNFMGERDERVFYKIAHALNQNPFTHCTGKGIKESIYYDPEPPKVQAVAHEKE